MLSKAVLRRLIRTDFAKVDKFLRFNSAFAESLVVKRDMESYDSFRRFCQIVGHWEVNGYGWYGMFEYGTGQLLGVVGAEYNPHLRNAEFALISSAMPGKNRLTWLMMYRYLLTEDWRKIEHDTYAIIAPDNVLSISLVEKSGGTFVREDTYAEGSKGKVYKLHWDKALERLHASRVNQSG